MRRFPSLRKTAVRNLLERDCLALALLAASLVSCSSTEGSPSTATVPAVPDLALATTWERTDRPFPARGRARISRRPRTTERPYCTPDRDCLCEPASALTLEGPRGKNAEPSWRWLAATDPMHDPSTDSCSGTGWIAQGEAEVEGTLHEKIFVLSKPPKYLNAPAAPVPSGSAQ